MSLFRIAVFVVVGAIFTGCTSISTMGLARTMPKGKSQMYINPSGFAYQDSPPNQDGTVQEGNISKPWGASTHMELGYRHAVSDGVELGGRLFSLGAGVDSKISLLRSPSETSGLNIAIDPSVMLAAAEGGNYWVERGVLTTSLPLLMGYRFSGHELTLTPKLTHIMEMGQGKNFNLLYAGGSIGFAALLNQNLRILPEVSVLVPLGSIKGEAPDSTFLRNSPIVQLSFGFLFDQE